MFQHCSSLVHTLVLTSCALTALVHSAIVLNGVATALPTEVQLSGAIVAAVENDVAEEEMEAAQLRRVEDDFGLATLEQLFSQLDEGRGKFHKQRKMLKYVYPLIMGALLAKAVLIPLVLKLLTALSTTSFVMSKVALAISALLAIKWIFASDSGRERTRLEVVHVPVLKAFHHGGSGGGWEDLSLSPSNLVGTKQSPHHKYIPVDGSGAGVAGGAYTRQPQPNYGGTHEIQPFL